MEWWKESILQKETSMREQRQIIKHSNSFDSLIMLIAAIPCQINTRKSLPSLIYVFLHGFCWDISEFQHSVMYGFRVRARRKIAFSETFHLNDLQFTPLVAYKISDKHIANTFLSVNVTNQTFFMLCVFLFSYLYLSLFA